MTVAKQFGADVINSVRVNSPQQVMLEVRFVEASRSASRELGVDWQVVQQRLLTAGHGAALATGLVNPVSGSEPFGTFLGSMLGNGVKADVLVRALEERGIVRRLAEPNLVALSGDTASFLAGGEFPIPVASNLGMITIEFKKYGVGLAFTPTVLGDGVINLKIEPEVSQIDPTTRSRSACITDPGADRAPRQHHGGAARRPELRDRRPAAEHQHRRPEAAALARRRADPRRAARSAAYQKKETDLVIIVTPRLVRPARPGDVLRTPLDGIAPGERLPNSSGSARRKSPCRWSRRHQGPLRRLARRRSATSSTFST